MHRIQAIFCFLTVGIICGGNSCESKKMESRVTTFTEADSLTEIYLNLQDSILLAWNLMINDDNQKIKAMHNLLHELQIAGRFNPSQLESIEQRVEQLKKIRYTPKSMKNSDVVDEYDFASNSLVTELVALAESHSAYSYNSTLQNLVEKIRTAEQRIENYRSAYDAIVLEYNRFLTVNKEHLRDLDLAGALEQKPLFQMVSE
jgi:hypothetical protein